MKQRPDDIKLLLEAVLEFSGEKELTKSNFGIAEAEVGILAEAKDYDSWKTTGRGEDDPMDDDDDDSERGESEDDEGSDKWWEKKEKNKTNESSDDELPWMKNKKKKCDDCDDKKLLTDEDAVNETDDEKPAPKKTPLKEESSMGGGATSGTMSISKKNQKPSSGEVDDEKEGSKSGGKSTSSKGSGGSGSANENDRGRAHWESPLPPPWLKRGDLYESVLKSVKSVINEIGMSSATLGQPDSSKVDKWIALFKQTGKLETREDFKARKKEIIGRVGMEMAKAILSRMKFSTPPPATPEAPGQGTFSGQTVSGGQRGRFIAENKKKKQ